MLAPRRFLPSMSSLLAFEAVGRLGTATAAAEELSLTHSAISRQLKVLEDQLGVQLLQRRGRRLALTAAGEEYTQSVRNCLQDLARASLKLKANPAGGSLNIAVLPAFAHHWLAPRLRSFSEANPDITINISTRLSPFDFSRENFDAAIHFGQKDWQGVEYLPLADERVQPACAPSLLKGRPTPSEPETLLEFPLLHLESRPGAWEEWFDAHSFVAVGLKGMLFDQFATMAEAASLGFGVALLPDYLAQSEFRAGRLVPAFPESSSVEGQYYLVWNAKERPRAPLARFIEWLDANSSSKNNKTG